MHIKSLRCSFKLKYISYHFTGVFEHVFIIIKKAIPNESEMISWINQNINKFVHKTEKKELYQNNPTQKKNRFLTSLFLELNPPE